MVPLWQAHLSFVLLGFVLLSAFRFSAPWRPWLLPLLAALSFFPVMRELVARRGDIDHILIETSGLALPKPLVQAFQWPEIRSACTGTCLAAASSFCSRRWLQCSSVRA